MKTYNPELIKKLLRKKINEQNSEQAEPETQEDNTLTVTARRIPLGGDLTYNTFPDQDKLNQPIPEPEKKEEENKEEENKEEENKEEKKKPTAKKTKGPILSKNFNYLPSSMLKKNGPVVYLSKKPEGKSLKPRWLTPEIDSLSEKYSKKYGIPKTMIWAIISKESGGRSDLDAPSPKSKSYSNLKNYHRSRIDAIISAHGKVPGHNSKFSLRNGGPKLPPDWLRSRIASFKAGNVPVGGFYKDRGIMQINDFWFWLQNEKDYHNMDINMNLGCDRLSDAWNKNGKPTSGDKLLRTLTSYNCPACARGSGDSSRHYGKGALRWFYLYGGFNGNVDDWWDGPGLYGAGMDGSFVKLGNSPKGDDVNILKEQIITEDTETLRETPSNRESLKLLEEGLTVFLNFRDEISKTVQTFLQNQKVSSFVKFIDRESGDENYEENLSLFMSLGGKRTDVSIPFFVFKRGTTYRQFDFDLNGKHKGFTSSQLLGALADVLEDENIDFIEPNPQQYETQEDKFKRSQNRFVAVMKCVKFLVGEDGAVIFDDERLKKKGFNSKEELAEKIVELVQKQPKKFNPTGVSVDKDIALSAFKALKAYYNKGNAGRRNARSPATLCVPIKDKNYYRLLDRLFAEVSTVFGQKTVKQGMKGLEEVKDGEEYYNLVIKPAIEKGLKTPRVAKSRYSKIKNGECNRTILEKYAAYMINKEAEKFSVYENMKVSNPKGAELLRGQIILRLKQNGSLQKELSIGAVSVYNQSSDNPYEHEMMSFDQTLANFIFYMGYAKVGTVLKTIQKTVGTQSLTESDKLPLDGAGAKQATFISNDILNTISEEKQKMITELLVSSPSFEKPSTFKQGIGWRGDVKTGIYNDAYDIERKILWAILAQEYDYNIAALQDADLIEGTLQGNSILGNFPIFITRTVLKNDGTQLKGKNNKKAKLKESVINHMQTFGADPRKFALSNCIDLNAECGRATQVAKRTKDEIKSYANAFRPLVHFIMNGQLEKYATKIPDALADGNDVRAEIKLIEELKNDTKLKGLYYFIVDALDKSPNFKGKLTNEFSDYFDEAKTSEKVKISNYPTIQRVNAYYLWAKASGSLPKVAVNTKLGMEVIK